MKYLADTSYSPVLLDFTLILIWLLPNNTHRGMTSESEGENIFKRFNIPEERADFCERLTEIGAFTNRWALTSLESSQAQSIWGITRQYLADNDTNTRNRLFSHWFSVTWLSGLDGLQTFTKWDFKIHSNAQISCLFIFYFGPELQNFASECETCG